MDTTFKITHRCDWIDIVRDGIIRNYTFKKNETCEYSPFCENRLKIWQNVECVYLKTLGKKPRLISQLHIGQTYVFQYNIISLIKHKLGFRTVLSD